MTTKAIHVYSGLFPKLAEALQNALPDFKIVNVPLVAPYIPYQPRPTPDQELQCLKGAEILVGDEPLFTPVLDKLPTLKFVQGLWAGVQAVTKAYRNKPAPPYPITRCVGATRSRQMAEFVIGRIIENERKWNLIYWAQQQASPDFLKLKTETRVYRTMWDLTVGIVGVGSIGKEIACMLKRHDCKVIGLTRNLPKPEYKSEFVDKYWESSNIADFLSECDYIVSVLPSTPETKNFLGGSLFKSGKKHPVLINIGRGDVIKESDLISALDNGWLSAAYLDVFETEPLPSDNPLWRHPKVIISPHVAAQGSLSDTVNDVTDNLERFFTGKPLKYAIDFSNGY